MKKNLSKILLVGLILTLILPLFSLAPEVGATQPPVPRRSKPLPDELQRAQEVSPELAMSKIDPLLQEAAEQGGKDLVDLYVSVKAGTDLSEYLSRVIVRPVIFGGTQNIYGQTMASNLLKIAQEPNVLALVKVGAELRDMPYDPEAEDAPDHQAPNLARLEALRANELTYAEAEAMAGDVSAQGWFDVQDGHKSNDAWKKGFTGEGVVVGVLDDGIDFGHPDLQGTYAWVTDPASPYYGWPMAFSQVSMLYFVQDIVFGVAGIAEGWAGSRWTDAQFTTHAYSDFEGTLKVWYAPLGSAVPHEYLVPDTSRSGNYKLGSFPERNLLNVYGERVAVLVVDERRAGVYDTVYVDLDNDYDFTDEKPVTRASPEIYRDMDGDGYADISGGLLVWISDGANVPPTANWLWGVTCADSSPTMKGCPDSGELVLFAGPFDGGYTHGTQCASNIAGQGRVSDGLTAQPFRVGGMVQGGAPDVGLMDFGNHYYTGTDEDEFLVAALGYDGFVNSGDEVQVTSNSYGNFRQMWGSWGYFGRLITALNMTIAPSTVWIFSSGNEGPGYGPEEGDGGPTTIMAGSSTQYGSTNWDSIASADQIMYGDVTAFFSKGPNRDGSSGLDVLANGGRGAGDEGINYHGFDGAESWDTWGGTSRSSPVVAGNLALVYQAYKARYGVWPTWDVARALLKSGASNASSSPFYQGAGVVNADRATDLAAGIYGVYATPDEWQVGDWEGEEYLNFAKVAHPGDTFAKTYTVNNPSGYEITADLSDGVMTLVGGAGLTFTTSDESLESGFNFHSPDYLMELDPSLIPADAELMVVRYVHPYSTFDPVYDFTANPNSSWRFLLYNWTDVNGDGNLWVDANGDGVVNHVDDVAAGPDNDGFYRPDYSDSGTEVQEGEYVRVDYDFGGLAQMIIVRDPLERMADGYFFGWQHRYNDGSVPTTTFQIGLEFYKRADWDWLSVSGRSVSVLPEDSATFEAVMAIPSDAAPGVYEGVIFMNDPGDENHAAHETALPVVVNVIAELPDGGSVTLGGGPMEDTLYQNSWTYGYFNWYGGGWTGAGDWRHYFLNLDDADLSAGNLLIHTSWADGYPTDFNTWVLGPTDDCASNGVGPCAWYEPGLGQPDPTIFGPYTLQPIASSDPLLSGAAYPFHTSTGGPDDWLKVPLEREGLHEIALHNVLYNGEDLTEQFQVDVGTIALDPVMDPTEGVIAVGSVNAIAYTETGTIELQFTPTLELPDLEATLTGGLVTTFYGPFTSFVPDSGGCYSAWCATNVYEPLTVTEVGTTRLRVHLEVTANQDADFFLVYDANDNGVAEEGIDPVVGSSGNASGTDEEIIVDNPALGRYFAVIDGYDVDPDSGVNLDWWYETTAPSALPTDPVDVFDGAVAISQDDPTDPTTASYSLVATATHRSAGLHATVTDIPAGSDVDLYVTDGTGAIVAKSQNTLNADEEIVLRPTEGEYRFEEGTEYTIWVQGQIVPTLLVSPTLHVCWEQLNLWLTASHPDVSVKAIGAGEMVSVTLHFDKPGWSPGDADMSARLIAGPSVLPLAFDELVTITRDDPPGPPPPPAWDPANLDVSITADSVRGASLFSYWSLGGVPLSTALVAAGEQVIYTVQVANLDPFDSPNLYVDAWPLPHDYICTYFGLCDDQVNGVDYGLISGATGTADYGGGIEWTGAISSGNSIEFSYWVEMPADMVPWDNHVSGIDVYEGTSYLDPWIGWDLAGGWYVPKEIGIGLVSTKTSTPDTVLPGEEFTYSFSLVNYSAEDKYIFFSDPLPDEVSFVSITGDAAYDADTHTVAWSGYMDGPSPSVDFDVVVQANPDLAYNTLIENEATLTDKLGGTPFAYLFAYTAVGIDTDLEIEKTVDAISGLAGDTLNYTIVFRNTGDQTALDVTLTDYLPSSLDMVVGSIVATTGTPVWDEATGLLSWVGDLAAGEEVAVTFQATINNAATPELALINAAWATATNCPTEVYSSALTEIFGRYYIYVPLLLKNYPMVECYCCSPGDSIYRIGEASFYGYTTQSASDSPLVRVTSPPAPLGWNQPDFVPGSSWQPAAEVWWAGLWDDPYWEPLPGDCRPIGLQDKYGNQEARGGVTHLYRRTFTLSPPYPGMQVTQAALEMWSDNKTEWWWQGTSVSYDQQSYIGQLDLFPTHVGPNGGTYVLAIQNSNDRASREYNPQGTACRLCVTWNFPAP